MPPDAQYLHGKRLGTSGFMAPSSVHDAEFRDRQGNLSDHVISRRDVSGLSRDPGFAF